MDSDFEEFDGKNDEEDGRGQSFEGIFEDFDSLCIADSDGSEFSAWEDDFYDDCWDEVMRVAKTERYWEKILACRSSLSEYPSPDNSLTFLNAIEKWVIKFGDKDKVLKTFSVEYTMGFCISLIFPRIKAPKKSRNKIRIKIRDIVEMLLFEKLQ
mmetsp:Transcript_37822/g.49787  ORF Transcript_37822/g.49787 Transcript_37822/m.49787 type:complete len:155 (+) Transcript_37822:34-498(+)